MATGILCGFEVGDTSECFSTAGTISVQGTTTRGAWSSYALQVNPATTSTGSVILTGRTTTGATSISTLSLATAYVRFYFRIGTLPASNNEEFFSFMNNASAAMFTLRMNSSGTISAYNASSALVTTGTAVLSTNTWYRIEAKVTPSNTVGVIEWKVNGVQDVSTTGQTIASNCSAVRFGKATNRNGQTVNFYYDDVLLSDSAYPGAGQCTCLLPNANGNYQVFTIGAGAGVNHYDKVNERPPDGDTSYLVSSPAGSAAETEALTNSSTASISGTINCVMSLGSVKRDGASSGAIKVRARSGSTDSDTVNFTTSAAYSLIGKYYDTDPATSLAWTTSGLDGLETGVVDGSPTNKSRLSFTAVMVDYTPAAGGSGVPRQAFHQAMMRRTG